jgi:hypothetical protein
VLILMARNHLVADMSEWNISPELRAKTEARLFREAENRLGHSDAERLRSAPHWFRAVHNDWPVLFVHARCDLIYRFGCLIARVPGVHGNWRAFLELARRADDYDEFLSAGGEWTDRAINLLRDQYQMTRPGVRALVGPWLPGGWWDDPSYHKRGAMNPRVADEIVALALSCGRERARVTRNVLPLVRRFYSLKWAVTIDTDDVLQKLIAKVLGMPPTMDWCRCYPFTASLSGFPLRRVTCGADQKRMYTVLINPPPAGIVDRTPASFPTI